MSIMSIFINFNNLQPIYLVPLSCPIMYTLRAAILSLVYPAMYILQRTSSAVRVYAILRNVNITLTSIFSDIWFYARSNV